MNEREVIDRLVARIKPTYVVDDDQFNYVLYYISQYNGGYEIDEAYTKAYIYLIKKYHRDLKYLTTMISDQNIKAVLAILQYEFEQNIASLNASREYNLHKTGVLPRDEDNKERQSQLDVLNNELKHADNRSQFNMLVPLITQGTPFLGEKPIDKDKFAAIIKKNFDEFTVVNESLDDI